MKISNTEYRPVETVILRKKISLGTNESKNEDTNLNNVVYPAVDGIVRVEDFIKATSPEFINSQKFKKVTTLNVKDVSAQLYLKLSAKYMVEGVPENWSGVETMMLK